MNMKHRLLASGAFGGMTANELRVGRFLRDGAGHPAPAAPAAPEKSDDDPFAAAFAEHAAEGAPAPASDAGDAGVQPAGDAPAAASAAAAPDDSKPAGDAPAGDAPAAAPAAAAPASDPPAPAPTPAQQPEAKPNADDVLSRLASLINQPPAAPQAEAPAEQAPIYTPEEAAILQEYEKNWPDVSKAETLRRRAEYHDMFKYIFEQVVGHTQPLFDQVRTIGNTLHTGELKTLVPDYAPALEEQVGAWVDTQPAYLQTAYKQVMQSGTSEEVADLIGRYRAATGSAPAAPAAQGQAPAAPAASEPTPPKPAATELSSLAKQAAESLAPVSGDRSQVPQGEDKGDFDSAFARHAATMA